MNERDAYLARIADALEKIHAALTRLADVTERNGKPMEYDPSADLPRLTTERVIAIVGASSASRQAFALRLGDVYGPASTCSEQSVVTKSYLDALACEDKGRSCVRECDWLRGNIGEARAVLLLEDGHATSLPGFDTVLRLDEAGDERVKWTMGREDWSQRQVDSRGVARLR